VYRRQQHSKSLRFATKPIEVFYMAFRTNDRFFHTQYYLDILKSPLFCKKATNHCPSNKELTQLLQNRGEMEM
jgi:hypothetical protein